MRAAHQPTCASRARAIASAIAMVMAPAAIHRQTQQTEVSERFVWVSTQLVLYGMLPLVLGLCLDIYLVARLILEETGAALAIAGAVLVLFGFFWVAVPRRERSLKTRA